MTLSENRYKIVYETIDACRDFFVIKAEGDFEPIVLKRYRTDPYMYVCFYENCMYTIELEESVSLHRIVDSIIDGWSDIDGVEWISPYI